MVEVLAEDLSPVWSLTTCPTSSSRSRPARTPGGILGLAHLIGSTVASSTHRAKMLNAASCSNALFSSSSSSSS